MENIYKLLEILPFELLKYDFMKNALLATLLITPLFALLGTMAVNNKMAFFSDALGHSAFTGIAIGVLLGLKSPTLSMIAFGIFLGLRDDIQLDIALEFRQEDRTGDRGDERNGADGDQQHKDDLAQHVEHGPRDAPGQMRLLFLLRLSCHDNSSVLREAPHPTDRRKNP